jgi:orotate phosphoribosyltransferase
MTVDQSPAVAKLRSELAERGAFLEGHFRLSSGRHSDRFIQKFRLLEDPRMVASAVSAMREMLGAIQPTVVVSAAVGGIVLGYEMARQYGCLGIFAEKEAGTPTFRRGFQLQPTDRVLIVEDVVTTGGSVKEVLELAKASGAQIEAVAIIVQRAVADFGVRTVALMDMPLDSYEPDVCPFCTQGIALQDPGSRRLGR